MSTSARNPHDALAGIGRYELESMYLAAKSERDTLRVILGPLLPLISECQRARALHPEGANIAALVEEVGEVSNAILERKFEHARTELIQVAATALRMSFGEIAPEPNWPEAK